MLSKVYARGSGEHILILRALMHFFIGRQFFAAVLQNTESPSSPFDLELILC